MEEVRKAKVTSVSITKLTISGGVQNVIRKDSKGKQREDDVAAGGGGGKKEKKATGFRGLRSGMNDFVRGKTE